jgi:signal transduction histidine kinase/CheY-like chemotaxis protein
MMQSTDETHGLTNAYWPADRSELALDQSIGEALREAASRYGSCTALIDGALERGRRQWSFNDLLKTAERAARSLLTHFTPGEQVAVWAANSPEWVFLEFGAALAGITLVTVNPAYLGNEAAHVLAHSRASGVFVQPIYRGRDLVQVIESVRADLPHLRHVISLGDWDAFIGSSEPVAPLPRVRPGDTAQIQYTFGVRGWACMPFVRPGRVQGIMGFDTFRPEWDKIFPFPVVRLAGDAMVNAIEREFLERDRATLATRLERARRMQMVGSLASGIAHNFNNIIGAILGYSEMVEPQLVPGSKSAQHVDEIRRAAERGRDLIDNLLTFGRGRDARVRSVWVHTLFHESASLLRASLPASVDFIVADVAAHIAVSGEPAQLQQVILNLCTNSAQAMEGGGTIRVTAEPKDVTAPLALSHGELAPGRFVCLSVADTGRGFDESVAQRLFEPFFTTRKAGTGLGLATVHEIVRDHDGAMNVQSKPGHGSRFEVWLPALADSAAPDTRVLPLGRGETVLIVESERLLRDEEMLAALGYEPVGFERADDAIAACRSAPDRFDAVVIGRIAANVNDLQVAHVVRGLMPRPPILLATASVKEVSVDELAEAGISEVLHRPLDSSELAAVLARRLRSASSYGRNAIPDC